MKVHQFSVAYQPEQDRLLMRANSLEGDEVALELTRRLMVRLWPRLAELSAAVVIRGDAHVVAHDAPAPLREMLADFRKAEMLRDADFETHYQTPHQTPHQTHGQPSHGRPRPLLVTHVEIHQHPHGLSEFRFSEQLSGAGDAESFHMHLDRAALLGWVRLIELAQQASQWQQPFGETPVELAAEPLPPGRGGSAAAARAIADALADPIDGDDVEAEADAAFAAAMRPRYIN